MKKCETKRYNILIPNINSWGNVKYGIPLRHSCNETRTSSSIGLRHIPHVHQTLDCRVKDRLPQNEQDMSVGKDRFKTTSGDYCIKASYNKANERSDCAMNCRNTIYMTSVQSKFDNLSSLKKQVRLSEAHDKYRGKQPTPTTATLSVPDPDYLIGVAPNYSSGYILDTSDGYMRYLDPYYTTNREYHRPFTADQQLGIGAKDHITFYSETLQDRGIGPRRREIWMPLQSKFKRGVYDRVTFKRECKPNMDRKMESWVPGAFKTETHTKFPHPKILPFHHNIKFNLPKFSPSPWQTGLVPAMYCTEYCHISQGTPPGLVVEQGPKIRQKA